MPLSLQFASRIQSRTVKGGREDGKRCISVFPNNRERSVVLGTMKEKNNRHESCCQIPEECNTHLCQLHQPTGVLQPNIFSRRVRARLQPNQSPNLWEGRRCNLFHREEVHHPTRDRQTSFQGVPRTCIYPPICWVCSFVVSYVF